VGKLVSTDSHLKILLEGIKRNAHKICNTPEDQINKSDYLNIDYRLHKVLLHAVDPFFREILEFVGSRSLRIRTFAEAISRSRIDGLMITVTKEHLQIIQALLEENAEEATSIVYKHLKNGEDRTLKAVREMLAG